MGAAGNTDRKVQIPRPEDVASVTMIKVWPTPKNIDSKRIPEPVEDKGLSNQTKHEKIP